MFPWPVSDLLFVGKSANVSLDKLNIRTIGDLANSDKNMLKFHLGKLGEMIWEYANGLDESSTVSVNIKDANLKSISRQKTLDGPTHLAKEVAETAKELIKTSWSMSAPIRALTITGMNLTDENYVMEQISLLESTNNFQKEK